MTRPIHHLVLPVTTLTLARGRLESLGFTVAADARHPFGTGNCCVYFENGTYLEPLTILDRHAADRAAAEGVIFVRRTKRFTERVGEGFAMLALRSDDAQADQRDFEATGVSGGPLFRFERNAPMPDGSQAAVGFALAFAEIRSAPDATFFTCQPTRDMPWSPDITCHANRAAGVIGVTAVAEDPAEFAEPLSSIADHLAVLTPADFTARYGLPAPEPRRGLVLAAFDLATPDPELVVSFAGDGAMRYGDRVIVPPAPGLGVVMSFKENP